jgi:hypothetical protein
MALLRTFPEEIEADIARYYPGRDIAQYWRGDMTARALLVLVQHLPEDSATVRAQRGTPWSDLMYLVAHIADTVAFARADYANAHGGNARPTPLPRPDTVEAQQAREQTRQVHDALTSMMRGELDVSTVPSDGRVYAPATDTT